MTPPTIALLTDFGTKDAYVGMMKAVISSMNPNAKILDISHNIRPQQVREAAYVLWSAYRYFPEKTVFVCVVDPTVGSQRKIVVVKTPHHTFIAPDNGLLDLVLVENEVYHAVSVTNPKFFLKNISPTFHGRDIFAPIAAHLSTGVAPAAMGNDINLKHRETSFVTIKKAGDYQGKIIYTDHFGNLITNIRISKPFQTSIEFLNHRFDSLKRTYSDAEKGKTLCLIGSSGLLEISVRDGNAKDFFGVRDGIDLKVEVSIT
ncbi:MAG: SAM hydrolase/SAM-dependent halogenase family protein [Chitinophagales bacterium]